jgi:hypothetical protein
MMMAKENPKVVQSAQAVSQADRIAIANAKFAKRTMSPFLELPVFLGCLIKMN